MKITKLFEIRESLHPKCCADEKTVCSRADKLEPFCDVYAFPAAKWRTGDCPMADNFLRETTAPVVKTKQRVGQQKQKKRR